MEKLGNITLYNCDCMEIMKGFKDKQFDLAIVDPPYGINADKKNSKRELKSKKSASMSKYYGNQEWDSDVPNIDYFNELIRISKKQIIWGVNYYPYSDIFVGGRLFWDKGVTMPTYSKGELAYLSFLNSIDYVKIDWHGMIQHDMRNKEIRIHPTQKPVQLYKWILNKYAKAGDTILDTHLGSGSSAIAALDGGFEFTGIELDEEYYNAAKERIILHQRQLNLF
jgi:site-specific DNA-methyltransferase (adenine-specific)